MEDFMSQEVIQRWRETAATHTQSSPVDETSICAKLCGDCMAFYRQLLRQLNEKESVSKPLLIRLTRNFETLVLWAHDHSLLRGALDWVFAGSRATRRCYLESITGICTTLLDRLLPLYPEIDMEHRTSVLRETLERGCQCLEEAIPNEDYAIFERNASWVIPGDNIDEVIQDLEVDLDCLREMDPLFTSPVLDPSVEERVASAVGVPTPYQPLCEQIRSMFPEAKEDTVHRVGKATWESFLRCIKMRQSNDKSGMVDINELARTVFTSSRTLQTKRTKDSGLGSSIATGAKDRGSYAQLYDGAIEVPPPPEEAQSGKPFECIACGQQVLARTTSAWRAHLFSDLRPYVCPFNSCSADTLGLRTRRELYDHLKSTHDLLFDDDIELRCPLCYGQIDDNLFDITGHLSNHLEEIALKTLQIHADVDSDYEREIRDPSSLSTSPTGSSSVPTGASHLSEHIDPEVGHTLHPTHTATADSILRYNEMTGPVPDSDYAPTAFIHRSAHTSSGQSPPISRMGPNEVDFIQTLQAQATADYSMLQQDQAAGLAPIQADDHPLWCELRPLSGCQAVFSLAETDLWIDHHRAHYGDRFPSQLVCWFCDHIPFVATHKSDRYSNFVNRMQHIREHIHGEYKISDDMRPDFRMISHMHELGLISESIHEFAMCYSELPGSLRRVPGEVYRVGDHHASELKLSNVTRTGNKSHLPSELLTKVSGYTLQDMENEVNIIRQKEENSWMEESQQQPIQPVSHSFKPGAEEALRRQARPPGLTPDLPPEPLSPVKHFPSSASSSTRKKTATGEEQISESIYHRRKHPRVFCLQCDDFPEGFRGEHELRRHTEAKHTSTVRKYICAEPDNPSAIPDGFTLSRGLENCTQCKAGKLYGVYYNAAAHLRKSHFKVKGGKRHVGDSWPPMPVLKLWMRQIEVPNEAFDEHEGSDGGAEDISGNIGVAVSKVQEFKEPDELEDRSNKWFRDTFGTPYKDDVGPYPGHRGPLLASQLDNYSADPSHQ